MAKKFINKYEDLEVFKLSYPISLEIHKLSFKFPRSEQFEIAGQIRRASKSVCSNIVEGFTKQTQSKKEFKRFLSMALGSCSEVTLWLKYCFDLGYIDQKQYDSLLNSYKKTYAMILKLMTKIVSS